jgi:ketosteroid isomerase-like protein
MHMPRAELLLSLAVLTACAAEPPDPGEEALDLGSSAERCGDLRPGRAQVRAADRLHSLLSERFGLRDGFAALLDPDVIYNAPGLPLLFGREAVLDYFDQIDPERTMRLSWSPSRIDGSIDGAFGYTFSWTETRQAQADGSETVTPGRNIAVWRRRNGLWRVVAYQGQPTSVFGTDPPADFGLFPAEIRRCVERISREQARGEALDADADFAALSVAVGPGPAFAAFAAADAALRPAGGWAIGPEQIAALFGLPDPNEVLDWTPTDGGAAGSADLAYTVGVASDTIHDPAGDQVFWSKYLTVWEKHPDGRWLYVVDGGSAQPPPAP